MPCISVQDHAWVLLLLGIAMVSSELLRAVSTVPDAESDALPAAFAEAGLWNAEAGSNPLSLKNSSF